METLNVYFRENFVTTLGPFKRYALWVNGCLKACPGCIYREHPAKDDIVEIGVIVEEILVSMDIEGITISGGEPMLQAEGLYRLITQVRNERDFGVILYTGYRYEELLQKSLEDEYMRKLLSCIDLLVDGEYIEDLNYNQSLIGSANQVVHDLTGRYNEYLCEYGIDGARKSEFRVNDGSFRLIGVPSKDSVNLLKLLAKKE